MKAAAKADFAGARALHKKHLLLRLNQKKKEGGMDFLMSHWHCLAPLAAGAAILVYTLASNKKIKK